MITAHHILAAFVVVLAYCGLALVKPQRKCGRCKGSRRSQRYAGVAGPQGKCRRCSGNGRHPRRGATAVHWFAWSVVVERLVQRRAERREDRGQQFSAVPRTASRTARQHAARVRSAQQRADRLIAYRTRLRAAPAW